MTTLVEHHHFNNGLCSSFSGPEAVMAWHKPWNGPCPATAEGMTCHPWSGGVTHCEHDVAAKPEIVYNHNFDVNGNCSSTSGYDEEMG